MSRLGVEPKRFDLNCLQFACDDTWSNNRLHISVIEDSNLLLLLLLSLMLLLLELIIIFLLEFIIIIGKR